jgi:rRNA maturation endonuclease Nob1
MARIDIGCRACGHRFTVDSDEGIADEQKQCPSCGSRQVRQSLRSWLRNGSLSDPLCGMPWAQAGSYG